MPWKHSPTPALEARNSQHALRVRIGVTHGKDINMTNRVWKCEQYRAGQVTNRVVFDTEELANQFVAQMQRMEPDIFWRMEPVDANMVWN